MFVLNIAMLMDGNGFYILLFAAQLIFYCAALVGFVLENKKLQFKPVFVPYYFFIMNYAVLAGLQKYLLGQQKVTWDKAERKVVSLNKN